MNFSPQLTALAKYLTGEFDNREQAFAEPAWYVHLRMWQRPIPLFEKDSFTLFAEQSSVVNFDKPYRQRIVRITQNPECDRNYLKAQYYMPSNPSSIAGGGQDPSILNDLTSEDLELLSGCVLNIIVEQLAPNSYRFSTQTPPNTLCTFNYLNKTVQVSLGFEATQEEFLSYDKGIDPQTGRATWGAILGPFRYTKIKQY
ncbi:MAG: chromophore lyase CpcT/CpeT [Cyanobacteria bacterium P01_A01_bin.45]